MHKAACDNDAIESVDNPALVHSDTDLRLAHRPLEPSEEESTEGSHKCDENSDHEQVQLELACNKVYWLHAELLCPSDSLKVFRIDRPLSKHVCGIVEWNQRDLSRSLDKPSDVNELCDRL